MAVKEKYIGEAPLKGQPKQRLSFVIKNGTVTWEKLSPEVKEAIINGTGIDIPDLGFEYLSNKITEIRPYRGNAATTDDAYAQHANYPSEKAVAKLCNELKLLIKDNERAIQTLDGKVGSLDYFDNGHILPMDVQPLDSNSAGGILKALCQLISMNSTTIGGSIGKDSAAVFNGTAYANMNIWQVLNELVGKNNQINERLIEIQRFLNNHEDRIRILEGIEPEVRHTVTFYANGGTGTMTVIEFTGTSFTVPSCGFSKNGYGFYKWALGSADSGTQYAEGETITGIDSDISLYAVWKKLCTISFNLDGGSGYVAPITAMEGTRIELPAYAGEKPNNRLEHYWIIENRQYQMAGYYIVERDVEATPYWVEDKQIQYLSLTGGGIQTVVYSGEEAQFTKPNVIAHYTDGTTADVSIHCSYVINVTAGSVSQYSADGAIRWTTITAPEVTEDTPVTISVSASYIEIHPYVTEEPKTYTYWAKVRDTSHTITFDANGGLGDMAPQTVEDGDDFTVPACTFTREDHTFVKWWVDTTDSNIAKLPGETIENVTRDLSLVAEWRYSATFTVNFIADGVEIYTVTGENGTTIIAPQVPAKSGYTVVGWNTNQNATTAQTVPSRISGRNLTFYAIYSQETPPTPSDGDWYVGQITNTKNQFTALSTNELVAAATAYPTSQKTVDFTTNETCWYMMIPEGTRPLSVSYLEEIQTVYTQAEIESGAYLNLQHDNVVINNVTYRVYGARTTGFVDGVNISITIQ